jgi:hypothetical protein
MLTTARFAEELARRDAFAWLKGERPRRIVRVGAPLGPSPSLILVRADMLRAA